MLYCFRSFSRFGNLSFALFWQHLLLRTWPFLTVCAGCLPVNSFLSYPIFREALHCLVSLVSSVKRHCRYMNSLLIPVDERASCSFDIPSLINSSAAFKSAFKISSSRIRVSLLFEGTVLI